MGRFILSDALRRELLHVAEESGCIVCRAARTAVERFFSWYRIEQYHEPLIIQRMQESHGFCPEHTRQFVAISSPHLVATVYRDLLVSGARLLRSAARESSVHPGMQADRIRPQIACLACKHQEEAVEGIMRDLLVGLTDNQVRAALLRPSALCQPHFIRLLPSLDWESAQLLAHAQLASLSAAGAEYTSSADPVELIRHLVGETSDEAFLPPPSQLPATGLTDTHVADLSKSRNTPEASGNGIVSAEQSSWSPTIATVETLLNASDCPICREEKAVAATYLHWLSQELSGKTEFREVDDARWLCRSHLWHFIGTGEGKANGRLLRSICAYWTGMVQALASGLDHPPLKSFAARCWHGMVNARQRTPCCRFHTNVVSYVRGMKLPSGTIRIADDG